MRGRQADGWVPGANADISEPPARLRDFFLAAILGVAGLIGIAAMTLLGPGTSGQFLVVGPPALGRDGVIGIVFRAQGAVVDVGGLPNIAIAAADRPDFAQALRAEGAWLVMPSPRIFGCFTGTGASGK